MRNPLLMFTILLLASFVSSASIKTSEACKNTYQLNNVYYVKERMKNVSGIPADISVHWKTGNIFFTLISQEMKMSLQLLHPSGELETIKVGGLGQSTTVDNLNDIVYLATDGGIYKYSEAASSVELYTASGEDVMYIAVANDGNTLYIATWPQNRVRKLTNGGKKSESFPAIADGHGLMVDPRNNLYYIAQKTPYILKSGQKLSIKINGLPVDKMSDIFVSRSDETYAMDEDSNFYKIDPDNASASLLGTFGLRGVNSFAMDAADNILVGVKGALIKFVAYERDPCHT